MPPGTSAFQNCCLGRTLGAVDVGALAMLGVGHVCVGRPPTVAVLSTGDELVPGAAIPSAWQIHDSNGPMLAALTAPVANVRDVGTVGDGPEALAAQIGRGLTAELLLVSGGVSMGAYDHVGDTLMAAGVTLHFRGVAIQPGKPVIFGTHPGGVVLALPGNPVSALEDSPRQEPDNDACRTADQRLHHPHPVVSCAARRPTSAW